jgi:hypothetical protein
VALVRERAILTERPPLVGEVKSQLLRREGVVWSARRIPTAVFSVFQTGIKKNTEILIDAGKEVGLEAIA